LNLAGVDSSVISADLTNNTAISNGAVVKSITTASTQTPSQGNVTHKLMANQNNVWNTAIVLLQLVVLIISLCKINCWWLRNGVLNTMQKL